MDFSTIKEIETKHAIKLRTKQNVCFVRGAGARLWDTTGKSYLDLAGGDSCLGYGDEYLTAAITDGAKRLASPPGEYYFENHGALLAKLLNSTGFNKAGLTGGGLEANLTALTLVHNYLKENGDNRRRIVVAALRDGEAGAAGGSTAGGLTGGYRRAFVRINDFTALKKALTPTTAVFVLQPVLEGGMIMADYDYLVNAYALCKSMGIILFCDETRIGIGSTGKKFSFEHYGIQPDLVTLSRGVAGGLPLGAVLSREAIAAATKPSRKGGDDFVASSAFGTDCTDGISALSCCAAGVVLDRLGDGLLQEVAEKGEYLLSRLYKLTKYNFVLNVRGRGLLAAVELSGRMMAAKVVSQMEKLGFLMDYTDGNVLKFSPPYTVTKSEIDESINALSDLFASTNI